MPSFQRDRPGITLAEVLLSTAIVGVMIVAALETVGASYRSQRRIVEKLLGTGLAQELMSEVLSFPFEDPKNPENDDSGPFRKDFDDVDDYNNWDRTDPVHRDGTLLEGYTLWQRHVNVEWADPEPGEETETEDTGFKRIIVTVTSPDGEETELVALRSEAGALEKSSFPTDKTIIHWLGAELQIGNSPDVAHSGTRLVNCVTDVN